MPISCSVPCLETSWSRSFLYWSTQNWLQDSRYGRHPECNGKGGTHCPAPPDCAPVSAALALLPGDDSAGPCPATSTFSSFSAEQFPSQTGPSLYHCRGPYFPKRRSWYLTLLNFRRFQLALSSSLLTPSEWQKLLRLSSGPSISMSLEHLIQVYYTTSSSSAFCNLSWGVFFHVLTKP